MMDGALNGVVKWLYSVVASLLNFISTSFLTSMGTSLSTFDKYFPFAATAYAVIQGFSFGLLFLIMLFQLFKNYLGPMSDAENPVWLLVKTGIFMVPVLAAKPIYAWLLDIVGTPYNALMSMGTDASQTASKFQWQSIGNDIEGLVTGSTQVGMIIALGVLIVLGWNFFKLVLEAAERYVIIGVLAYLAPLPFSTGGSKATNNVFKSWCRMAASQLIMLVLNVWSVKIVISSFDAFGLTNGAVVGSYNSIGGVITWTICMLAFLKIAQKLDTYMAQIGMSTAQTGGSLLEEVIVAGQGVKAVMSAAGGVANRAMTGSAAGGVLGALGMSAGAASSIRSMFGGAAGTKAGAAAASAVTGAGFGDAVGDVPSSGIGNGGTVPGGGGSKGGKSGGSAGAIGGLAQRIAVNRFNSGLRATDADSAGFAFATNTISNIARGDSKQVGTLSDNINAANPETQTAGTRAFQHYFSQNHQNGERNVSDKYTAFGHSISNVTMGDGHISGLENGQRFDMYSADKYHTPEGEYTTQAAQDGSTWYKVMTPANPQGAQANSASNGSVGPSGSTGTASSYSTGSGNPSSGGFNAASAASHAPGAGPSGRDSTGSDSGGFNAASAASHASGNSSTSGNGKSGGQRYSPKPPQPPRKKA